MQEYKVKIIPLHKNRKLINAVKKAGIETFNPEGSWNGYGYERLPLAAKITSLAEMRKFSELPQPIEVEASIK